MNSIKYLVALFFFAACVLAIQAAEGETQQAPAQAAAPRDKRFYPAYGLGLGLGYSAYHAPLAYHAPVVAAAYHAPVVSSYAAYHAPVAYGYGAYGAYGGYHW